MAKIKSSIKDVRRSAKRALRNRAVKSAMRSAIREARRAKPAEMELLVRQAVKLIDRAAAKGVIKKSTASRRVGRLMSWAHGAAAKGPADVKPA